MFKWLIKASLQESVIYFFIFINTRSIILHGFSKFWNFILIYFVHPPGTLQRLFELKEHEDILVFAMFT